MRIFASERVSNLMLKLGMEEGVPIEHSMVTKSIEGAQKNDISVGESLIFSLFLLL